MNKIFILLLIILSFAVGQDSPAPPNDANSAMYTIDDLYNRLNGGTTGSKRGAQFVEPGVSPGTKTMHTLDQVMTKAPLLDNVNGASAANTLFGKTFWGLTASGWGLLTGTMANNGAVSLIPGISSQTIAAGYHSGSGSVAGDANLVSGNIKSGTSIFGVSGDANVVNTSTGDADSTNVSYGKKAWVKGSEVSGVLTGGTPLKPGGTFSPSKRWYDNGNGTITDVTSGLIWLKNVGSVTVDPVVFVASNSYDLIVLMATIQNGVAGLSDGSTSGDWRIPTKKEMARLTSGTEAVIFGTEQLFIGISNRTYWTTTKGSVASQVAVFRFATNAFEEKSKNITANTCYVMPVRDNN